MNADFKKLTQSLDVTFRKLMNQNPVVAENVPNDTPVGGVYLFSENGEHLYAGRTKRKISIRIKSHFSTADDCPFAWLIAREKTGRKATYKKQGSRKSLLEYASFKKEYDCAKERIRKMEVRFVQEPDPLKQALLEIYTAVASGAKYNDFDTH